MPKYVYAKKFPDGINLRDREGKVLAFGRGEYNPDTFLDNVRWYNENVLRRYSFIVGGTIFTLGNWENGKANFQASFIELADYITSLPDAVPDDPPIQPPFVYPVVRPLPS